MKREMLKILFSISIKARALRAWQEASEGSTRRLTEKEVLVLELVEEFADGDVVTEAVVCKIFGMSPSSASDLVKKLVGLGLLQKKAGDDGITRGMPLQITAEGRAILDHVSRSGAARLAYLFAGLSDKDLEPLTSIFQRIDKSASLAVKKYIFGHYELDFEAEDGTPSGPGTAS